jgi:hypothetical protein
MTALDDVLAEACDHDHCIANDDGRCLIDVWNAQPGGLHGICPKTYEGILPVGLEPVSTPIGKWADGTRCEPGSLRR